MAKECLVLHQSGIANSRWRWNGWTIAVNFGLFAGIGLSKFHLALICEPNTIMADVAELVDALA